jgi:hypothetical protein
MHDYAPGDTEVVLAEVIGQDEDEIGWFLVLVGGLSGCPKIS